MAYSTDTPHPYVATFYAFKRHQADSTVPLGAAAFRALSTVSPAVSRCITIKSQRLESQNDLIHQWTTDSGYLNWQNISRQSLGNLPTEQAAAQDYGDFSPEEIEFYNTAHNLQKLATQLHDRMKDWSVEELFARYSSALAAYRYEDTIEGLFGIHLKYKDTRLAFAVLCTYLERFLGDVFASIAPQDKKCPRILRDLLLTDEIGQFFSTDMIFFLQAIIGPPIGLNLRNIYWHGFVSDSEFDEAYLSLLIVVMASVANHFQQQSPSGSLSKRDIIDLSSVNLENYNFGLGPYVFSSQMEMPQLESIRKLFSESIFLMPGRHNIVERAIALFNSLDPTIPADIEYHRCLVMLYPQLEHSLRRIFIGCNNLPSMLMCAESRRYFSTIDLFLKPKIEVELPEYEGLPNKIADELGPEITNALWDMFIHPAGLRPRDRISHGEAKPETTARVLVDRVIGIYVALSVKYHPDSRKSGFIESLDPIVSRACNFFANYKSCFHPLPLLQRSVMSARESWKSLKTTIAEFPLRAESSGNENTADDDNDGCVGNDAREVEDEDSDAYLYAFRRNDGGDLGESVLETYMRLLKICLGNKQQERTSSRKVWSMDTRVLIDGLGMVAFFNVEVGGAESFPFPSDTLYHPSVDISIAQATRTMVKHVGSFFDSLQTKLVSFRTAVQSTSESLSKRQQNSFYKLLGYLDLFFYFPTIALMLAEMGPLKKLNYGDTNAAKQKLLKVINRISSVFQKSCTSIEENMWPVLLDAFKELWGPMCSVLPN